MLQTRKMLVRAKMKKIKPQIILSKYLRNVLTKDQLTMKLMRQISNRNRMIVQLTRKKSNRKNKAKDRYARTIAYSTKDKWITLC